MTPESPTFLEKNLNTPGNCSTDHSGSVFTEKYQNRSEGKARKKRFISGFGILGTLGSIFFVGKMMRSFLKKGRRGKNDNSNRRIIIGLILFAVTISVVVGLLLAGASGEGGFIWLLVVPAIIVVWLIYLASGKSKKSVTAPNSD